MARVLGREASDLRPDDFEGDFLVVTIEKSEDVQTRNGRRRVVRTVEYPDRPFWCNTTQTARIVSVLGNDDDEWKGKKLPLRRTQVEIPNVKPVQYTEKWYPCNAAEWHEVVSESEGQKEPEPERAARGARKRSGK